MAREVLVLGGGIVGIGAALQLTLRGHAVTVVDRREPGEETSFGNAGLIQSEAILPYAFPRDLFKLIAYALNLKPEAHYHLSALPTIAPTLWRYFRNGSQAAILRTAAVNLPLFARCLAEHRVMARAAGVEPMLRPDGWLKVFRSQATFNEERAIAENLARDHGVKSDVLDVAGVNAVEPHVSGAIVGGIHWRDPYSIADPHALTIAYARQFETLGGRFVVGDAQSLQITSGGWRVATSEGVIEAPDCLIALGPWSTDLIGRLGYRVPLFVKRGYHMHYRPRGNAQLGHPVLDADVGYMMAPMARGIRITTGAEFALRDAPATPVQLERIEPHARGLFPLEERLDALPWLGRRPCLPDMVPVMGAAPRHRGLWFSFGHAHHGLTLAGSAGRLLAEMIGGEAPFTDPAPYSIARFGA